MQNATAGPLLFVINPISGTSNKKQLDSHIDKFCQKNGINYQILKTTGKKDGQKIRTAIKELKPKAIIAGGGDGTVNLVAEQILSSEIMLSILPLGSANGLATELEIPEGWEENFDMLIRPRVQKVDAIQINEKHLSLHLCDMGFNAELIREFEKEGKRGLGGYARSFFKKLAQRKSGRFKVVTPTSSNRYKAEMIVIANASSYGTGAIVNPRSDLGDGKFEVCIFKPFPWRKIISMTWHSFVGNLEESEYFAIHQTNEVTISSKHQHTLQVDGEVIGDTNILKAKCIPAAIRLIVPDHSQD
ncbi:diacylglycerol/lipid kinase family protein [Reichenbachiella ulvae]|uniref:YegS/Rv2252/BmrU family lipid kinase n=1 Tax=Reichenbachiella ulvae TaxID=2980104 RepID=A0ABT3CVV4_9BACT|nr:YegS/Rv2252/BmrU family lipid kinase [Reichenbachiella ulvae]MCV9387835.1 YegS/Rv2252/BmrU family lipid kinase [Reichenbachiella ulvae]